jgi:hypothetical protein
LLFFRGGARHPGAGCRRLLAQLTRWAWLSACCPEFNRALAPAPPPASSQPLRSRPTSR